MKKIVTSLIAAATIATIPLHSEAATIKSGKAYVPTKNYVYKVYGQDDPNTYSKLTCKGPISERECADKDYFGYTHAYDDNAIYFGIAGSWPGLISPVQFPMTTGKTYSYTTQNIFTGEVFIRYYKVVSTNLTKKVGKKTYKHVIKLDNLDTSYTYIAKNHGVILLNYKENGKMKTYYKVMDYWKK